MRSLINKSFLAAVFCASLLSFVPKPGGEGFEIYLGQTLLTQQYGTKISEVKNLSLTNAGGENLVIKYYHCGQIGKNRYIVIKDGQDRPLKKFHYPDAATAQSSMSLKVDELLSLKKNASVVKLFYSSSELPNGRELVTFKL